MRQLKKTFYIIIAILLVALGVTGIILPFLHGTMFLMIGLILLSFEIPYIEYHLERLVQKNDRINILHKKLHNWTRKIFK